MRQLRVLLALTLAIALSGVMPASAVITSKIESVDFADAANGYLAGGYYDAGRVGFVSRTSDGGASWTATSEPGKWMYGVDALSPSGAWVVSDYADKGWSTADGGATWTLSGTIKSPFQSASMSAMDVVQLSSGEIIAVGEQWASNPSGDNLATAWRSTDGGVTWSERWSGPQDADPYTSYETAFDAVEASPDGQAVFAVGGGKFGWVNQSTDEIMWDANQARALKSTDHGATWSQVTLPASTDTLEDVAVVSPTSAWAVGNTTVFRTSDGSTWQSVTMPSVFDTNAIATRGTQRVAIAGELGKVIVSVDGGASWKPVMTMTNKLGLNGIAWLDDTHLVAVGDNQLVARIELNADGTYKSTAEVFTVAGDYGGPADIDPPLISVSGVDDGKTYAPGVKPDFSATDAVDKTPTVTATLDGVPWVSAPVNTPGVHTLVVTATDRAGNRATKTVVFTIDAAAPVITISGVKDGDTYGSAVTPVFSAVDANDASPVVTATLDGGAWVSGNSVPAPDGEYAEHTLVVNAHDAVGNSSSSTVHFTIDKTAPVITLTGVANGQIGNTTVTPVFSAKHEVTGDAIPATATLNGTPFVSGTPIDAERLHELVITATGSGSTASTSVSFTIDKTAPAITIDAASVVDGGHYQTVTPTFSAVDANLASASATLNGQPFASGDFVGDEGVYNLEVTAADLAGNTNTKTVSFTVDSTAPKIVLDPASVSNGGFYKTPVTPGFDVTDADVQTIVSAKLDGVEYKLGTPVTNPGVHAVEVIAIDRAGNVAADKVAFTIDTTKPTVSASTPVYSAGSAKVTLTANDAGGAGVSSIGYSLDGVEWVEPGSAPVSVTVTGYGPHYLEFWTVDWAGNESALGSANIYVKQPTTVTLTVPTTSSYGSATLAGYLKTGTTPVPGKYVEIWRDVVGDGKAAVKSGTTKVPTTSTGYFSYPAAPTTKTRYYAKYLGDTTTYLADASSAGDPQNDTVTPRVRLTRTTSWSTLSRYTTYYARGYIEPRHYSTSGKVVIRAYKRMSNGQYPTTPTKTFSTGSTYTYYSTSKTAYKVPVRFTSTHKGYWKLVAYHYGDSTNAATYGSTDYIYVK
jgi:hypothetical protein